MAKLETVQETGKIIAPEVVFPGMSKYAFNIITPESAKDKSTPLRILICGHGSLSHMSYDDMVGHSRQEASALKQHCDKHNIVALMPVLPRFEGTPEIPPLDAQMFGSPTMIHNWSNFYYRPDQEIIKVVHHLVKTLTEAGYSIASKFLVAGISAGANMANRFALLYPELVAAVAIPLAGNYSYPVAEYKGIRLPYPFGTANINEIPGNSFDGTLYKRLPFFVYDGKLDNKPDNDPLNFEARLIDRQLEPQLRAMFGSTPYERFLHFAKYMQDQGASVTIESSEQLGHRIEENTLEHIFNFFDQHTKN